ncbi:MAG: c-type cytochrome [Pseudomonadota bacterium]
MSKFLKAIAASALIAVTGPAAADPLGLGRAATPAEVAAWDIDIRPDGAGLPEGSGDVLTGEEVFVEKCAVCHGDFAEGVDRWPVLAGGQDTLASDDPVKTVGSYWPYLSTVWDYVNRAMPFGNAQSLTPDEVYGITAYLLYSNDLVDDEFELNHENFAELRLPNEDNFFMDDREQSPIFANRDACMSNCKTDVKITMRARVLDVTPEGADDDAAEAPAGETVEVAAATTEASTEPEQPALDAELVTAGEKVFKKCKACHQVGDKAKNRVGPVLNGIVDASLGAVDGFKYSKALKAKADEGRVWDDASLAAFLEKPKAWMKGTKMSFAGLKKEQDRLAVIEFLKSHSQ